MYDTIKEIYQGRDNTRKKSEGKVRLMIKNYSDLLKLNDAIYDDGNELSSQKEKIVYSIDRTVSICENNQQIINSIENDFLKKTKLQKKDIPFLFLATALQTLRWVLLPSLDVDFSQISKDDRLSANDNKKSGPLAGKKSGQRYEKPEIYRAIHENEDKYNKEVNEYRNKLKGKGEYHYLSWIEILMHPVPYDAMAGSENINILSKSILGRTTFSSPIGKQLVGKNHHVATLGHDPILGWVFGTMNIASASITFCDLQTYPVVQSVQLDKWGQSIDYMNRSSVSEMLKYCINSFHEDTKRIPAAIARQAIHMQSDKYTKDGLPIPLLTPEKAQKLINQGWNSNEAERLLKKVTKNAGVIAAQFMIAELINMIIRSIYLFMFPDDGIRFNKVKIEKILTISSLIAEGSNVAVVAATRDISKLDIGGLISLVHQIAINRNTQLEIEMEFINSEFRALVMEDI